MGSNPKTNTIRILRFSTVKLFGIVIIRKHNGKLNKNITDFSLTLTKIRFSRLFTDRGNSKFELRVSLIISNYGGNSFLLHSLFSRSLYGVRWLLPSTLKTKQLHRRLSRVPHQRHGRDGWEWPDQDSWTWGRPDFESFIAKHSSVAHVIVIGVPDQRLYEEICACVVFKDGQDQDDYKLAELDSWFEMQCPLKRRQFVMEARPHRQFWEVPQDEKRKIRLACNKENRHGEIEYQDW